MQINKRCHATKIFCCPTTDVSFDGKWHIHPDGTIQTFSLSSCEALKYALSLPFLITSGIS